MFDIQNDIDTDTTENQSQDSSDAAQKTDSQKEATLSDSSERVNQELQAVKDQFSRLTADFQNYKRRVDTERLHIIDASKKDLLLGLLSIVDNFDRALDEAKNHSNEQLATWVTGFELIHKALYDYLASYKVTPITQVTLFDPHLHEAVMQVQDDAHQSGDIVKVFEKGFMYKDAVLRTAKVSVAA